jgi:hypothetical protein
MLARTPQFTCVQCGAGDERFAWHGGRPERGPAYWSDRGPLCGVACALAHAEARRAEGSLSGEPAPAPFEEL